MPAATGMPPESRFGDRVKDVRLQLDLSVEALSRLTKRYDKADQKGISAPTLGRYEANETTPSLRELRLIAEALDVPVQWLVDGNLPEVKGGEEIQALISAMRRFVEHVNQDITVGGVRVSELTQSHQNINRAVALVEARRAG
jgi:transcriptional regulator with XRE-family HTH domain